jgi:hypothetical protein
MIARKGSTLPMLIISESDAKNISTRIKKNCFRRRRLRFSHSILKSFALGRILIIAETKTQFFDLVYKKSHNS